MPRGFRSGTLYTVKPGDTLSAIAASHACGLDLLIAANAALVSNPNIIQVGWQLQVPGELSTDPIDPPAGDPVEEHVVRAGDTVGALARNWGTTTAAIAELNGIVNVNVISIGQRIRRPGASATTSAAAVSTTSPREKGLRFTRWPIPMPPGRISGGYRQDYGGYLHRGIDIAGVPVGSPVFAPADGIVRVHRPGDGWGSGGFGICVILDHPGTPWWSIYGHLNEAKVRNGDSVGAGTVIGTVGFTGHVIPSGPAGAHLHWQLSNHARFPPDFQYIANPRDFLQT